MDWSTFGGREPGLNNSTTWIIQLPGGIGRSEGSISVGLLRVGGMLDVAAVTFPDCATQMK